MIIFTVGCCVQELAQRTDNALMEMASLDNDVKIARQIIIDITETGTEIYDGLAKEAALKEARQRAIAKQTDKADVERAIEVRSPAVATSSIDLRLFWGRQTGPLTHVATCDTSMLSTSTACSTLWHCAAALRIWCVQEAIEQLGNESEGLESSLEELYSQKNDSLDKVKRKRAEFERMEQRLMQLKNVKAPYQDELDGLESELGGLYSLYLDKSRSLEYVQAELDKHKKCADIYTAPILGVCSARAFNARAQVREASRDRHTTYLPRDPMRDEVVQGGGGADASRGGQAGAATQQARSARAADRARPAARDRRGFGRRAGAVW